MSKEHVANDDFEREAETLRNSEAVQRFLDERSRSPHRISLDELEAETDGELAKQRERTAG